MYNNEEKISLLWDKKIYYEIIEESNRGKYTELYWVKIMSQLIDSNNYTKVLDVGCGEGGVLQELSRNKYVSFFGVDVTSTAIEKANDKKCENCKFDVYNGARIPYEDGCFDLVYSTFVLEHISDPELFFSEMSRVTRTGGQIMLVCPNYGSAFFRSPCNHGLLLPQMIKRIIMAILPAFFFSKSFRWNTVEPIVLREGQHIMDYDTVVEPNLLFFKKFILFNKQFKIVEICSLWEEYVYGGNNYFKKIALHVLKYLGSRNFPIIKDYGPLFYILLKK